jgi:3-deoxy-7-phosphoheptulonate synthase
MASGLSSPVGFKNGTDGDVRIAIDAVLSALQPHHFLAVTKGGRAAIAATKGNEDCQIVLRGGRTPNFEASHVNAACSVLTRSGLSPVLMIDASHANSGKKPENQPLVIENVAGQIEAGDGRIIGVMLESHLVGGSQALVAGRPLRYGQSITDGCLGWEETVTVLDGLAASAERRRKLGTPH